MYGRERIAQPTRTQREGVPSGHPHGGSASPSRKAFLESNPTAVASPSRKASFGAAHSGSAALQGCQHPSVYRKQKGRRTRSPPPSSAEMQGSGMQSASCPSCPSCPSSDQKSNCAASLKKRACSTLVGRRYWLDASVENVFVTANGQLLLKML